MFIGLRLLLDTPSLYLERRTPQIRIVFVGLVSRSIWLVLLAFAIFRGLLVPPFWAALTLVAIWVVQPVLVFTIFVGPTLVRDFIKRLLVKLINPVSFEHSSSRTKLLGLQLGYVDADTYVSSMSSMEELIAFTDKLADSDFAGFELELFEAVQNAERRILQSKTEPGIFSTYDPLEKSDTRKIEKSDRHPY